VKVIQHRYNDPLKPLHSKYVEIDVHVAENSTLIVKHDPDDNVRYRASYMAKLEGIEGFFVDIKQSLDIQNLKRIADNFGDKLIGLFDVPFPSAYFARKAGIPVYGRISEFEPIERLFDRFWIDPLTSWNYKRYVDLLKTTDQNHKVIIAAPSLHGHGPEIDIKVALALMNVLGRFGQVEGIVTKYPQAVEEALRA